MMQSLCHNWKNKKSILKIVLSLIKKPIDIIRNQINRKPGNKKNIAGLKI